MFFGQTTSVLRIASENFFPLSPSGKYLEKKFEFNQSVHTFGILRAPIYSMPMVVSLVAILEPLWGVKGFKE